MFGVLIYRLNRAAEDELVGAITLANGQLEAVAKNHSRLPAFILRNPTAGRPGQPPILANQNPLGFLNNLRYTYTSPYLRCTGPQSIPTSLLS